MRQRTTILLATIALGLTVFGTYRLAFASEDAPVEQINMHGFGDSPCLVVFDLGGSDGVERTVLVGARVIDVGGKRFLNGTVTDKCADVRVVFPGTSAFVALDKIAFIQLLDLANLKNGG